MSTATMDRTTDTNQRWRPSGVVVDYRRISKFRVQQGAGYDVQIGVDRQGEDNARRAADMDLGPIARTFEDLNYSASKYRRREREDFPELLAYIRTGAVSYVLFWVVDRIIRDTDEQSALLAACREGGTLIVQTHNGTVVDPNDPDAVMVFKILGAVAEAEVAKMSMRNRRQKVALANAGKFHGGGRRRFGYEPAYADTRESEAVVIREMVARLLGGESIRSLLRWLNDGDEETGRQPIPAPSGKPWRTSSLRQMLMSPHLAGLRVHQGDIVGDAVWPAIIDRGTHEAVVALLSDPGRRTTTTNARKHLLTGLATCGVCSAPLRVRIERNRPVAYGCSTGSHVQRQMAMLDLYVTEAVIARLTALDETGALTRPDDGAELAHLQAAYDATVERHEQAGRDYAAGKITADTLAIVAAGVEEEKARLSEELAAAKVAARKPRAALSGMTGDRAREAFTAAPLGRQRAVIETLCSVALNPSSGSREKFKPAEKHVTLVWRKDDDADA